MLLLVKREAFSLSSRMEALLVQLQAEMNLRGEGPRSISRAVTRPYVSLRPYLVGERSLPIDDLLEVLDYLEVPYDTFMTRVMQRLAHVPVPPPETAARTSSRAAQSDSLVADLERLGELRIRDLLTHEEFQAAKARLLA